MPGWRHDSRFGFGARRFREPGWFKKPIQAGEPS